MKNNNIKILLSFALLSFALISYVSAVNSDIKFPGIDDATQISFSYLKSKFGDDYFSKSISYLDTARIPKSSALGLPNYADGNSNIPGSAARKENDSDPFYTNQIKNESLDYYLVRFKHIANIENKYYTIGFVELYLDSNYQIVRSLGVLNCVENKNLCIYTITEEQAYKITSDNIQFKSSRKTAQLIYHGNYNKIVWVISLYSENENSFGKSIIIDSFNGDIIQKIDFVEDSYNYNNNISSVGIGITKNTVEPVKLNIFQKFLEWIGSFFK